MKWAICSCKDQPFVRVTLKGVFNPDDYLWMLRDLISQDFWKPGTFILLDNRKLDFSKSNYEAMRKASFSHEDNDEQIGNGKIAFLMNSTGDYGLGRQYENLAEGRVSARIHVFIDEATAIGWLRAKTH